MRLVLVAEVDEGNTSCHRSSIYKEQNIRTWLPSILLRNNKQYVVSRSADSSVNSTNAVAGSFQFVFVRPRCQGYEQSSAYLGVVSSMPFLLCTHISNQRSIKCRCSSSAMYRWTEGSPEIYGMASGKKNTSCPFPSPWLLACCTGFGCGAIFLRQLTTHLDIERKIIPSEILSC
jgi:hypothetical protein